MLKDSDIIIFSLSRWDAAYSSPSFSLAKEFSKHNRVFYIDHPYSIKDFLLQFNTQAVRKRKKALLLGENIYTRSDQYPPGLTMVTTRLTLPINFLPTGAVYDALSEYNQRVVFNTIRQVIKDFQIRDFIFLNAFNPFFCRDFPPDIKPLKKIYQCMDDLTEVPYTARHGTQFERDIIRNYDVTLVTSHELKRLKLKVSNQVWLHPNAADFNSFKRAVSEKFPRPPELAPAEGKKIIGYTGNIESRIDYELIKAIAEFHHDKMLVMIGPLSTPDHKTIGLTEIPNVITTGSKKIEQLPAYLQYFDCTIIPFKKNKLTKSIYPLKINEYLAAGRPVVATDFSEDIRNFGDVIYIAKNIEEFIQLIDTAILENGREKISARTAVAQNNTWTARVEQFWEIVGE